MTQRTGADALDLEGEELAHYVRYSCALRRVPACHEDDVSLE